MLTKHTNNSEYVFFEAWMCVVYALHSLFVPYLLRKTNKLVRNQRKYNCYSTAVFCLVVEVVMHFFRRHWCKFHQW